MPAPEYEHKSLSKSKYADSIVELDTRIGHIMDKLRELGLDQNTLVLRQGGSAETINTSLTEY